ncbi:MAG: GAF domain-containing protein [Anaerolineae bacterium]|nr:GAF domain-containing protein [Anaerolineae bacterium]
MDLIRVLIIEDNRLQIDLIREYLSRAGETLFEVAPAARLSAGLKALTQGDFDIILLDLQLPDSAGLDTFARVYAQAADLPIIILSGLDDKTLASQAVQEGAQDYLVKGEFGHRVLPRAIHYAIQRKEIERALRASEAKFRSLSEYSPVGIVLLREGELGYTNPALAHIFGYTSLKDRDSPEQLLTLVHPQDHERIQQQIAALFEGQETNLRFTFQGWRANGETFEAELHAGRVQDHKPATVIATVVDVDEQRRMARQLKQQNAALTALNTIATTVNRSLDLDVILNTALDQIIDLELFSTVTRGCILLLDEHRQTLQIAVRKGPLAYPDCAMGELPVALCQCGRAITEKQTHVFRYAGALEPETGRGAAPYIDVCIPLQARDQVLGVLGLRMAPATALDEQERALLEAVGGQIAVAINNAQLYQGEQQRNAEMAVLHRTGQLITSSLNLNEVLEIIIGEAKALLHAEGVSILLYDRINDELVFRAAVGPHAESTRGMRFSGSEGIAGWALREQQPVLVSDVQQDTRFFRKVDETTGLMTRSLIAAPLQCKGKITGVVEAINRSDRPFDEHDLQLLVTLSGSAAIAIENAQLYEAEREQRELVEQSQAQLLQNAKLAATGRLAASMAHEINNPLQAIHNSLQMILTFPFGPEEQHEYIQMADEEVERLIHMVKRILDFSRRPQNELKVLDVNAVLQKVIGLAHKYLQHRDIVLHQALTPELPQVLGNATNLGQVFLNLIINAVDSMSNGGELHISTAPQDHGIDVRFRDTGSGVPAEIMDRIFEPFFSTKTHGTGLGLSISYGIVKQHNGDITVESAVGQGATFTVTLPAYL